MVFFSQSISTLITTTKDLLLVLLLSNYPVLSSTYILETGGGMRLLRGELIRGHMRDYRQHKQGEFLVNMNSYSGSFLTALVVQNIVTISQRVLAVKVQAIQEVGVRSGQLRSPLWLVLPLC